MRDELSNTDCNPVASSAGDKSKRRLFIGLAVAVVFTDAIGYTMIIPSLPDFSSQLDLTESQTGLLYASYGLVSLLLYLPFGVMVDRWGPRFWLTSGMLVLGVSSVGFWLANGFVSLLTCRVLQGVAASATWAAALPFAASLTNERTRGVDMSLLMMAFSIGGIAGPALGSIGNARDPFVYFCGVPFALAACSFFMLRKAGSPDAGRAEASYEKPAKIAPTGNPGRKLTCSCLVILATCGTFGALELLLPLRFSAIGWSRQEIGLFFAGWGLAMFTIQPMIGRWSDRRGRKEPILFGLLLSAALTPVTFSFLNSAALVPLALFLIFGLSAALTPTLALMVDDLPEGGFGKAFGIYNMAFSLGIVLGPLLGGYVSEHLGVLYAAALCSLALVVVVPPVLLLLRLEKSG